MVLLKWRMLTVVGPSVIRERAQRVGVSSRPGRAARGCPAAAWAGSCGAVP